MSDFINNLKSLIIKELKLQELLGDRCEEISADMSLFENELFSLDSIDALRIVVVIEKNYNVQIKDLSSGKKILYSINTIADYIREQSKTTEF